MNTLPSVVAPRIMSLRSSPGRVKRLAHYQQNVAGFKFNARPTHAKDSAEVYVLVIGEMPIENVAPGLVLDMLNNRDYLETKSDRREKSHRHEAHNDEDCAWIANVTNPKKAPLQLAMMSDLAWNKHALKAGIRNYLQSWLNQLFGSIAGKKIQPLMEEYYRLTSIRQPAYMASLIEP